MKRIKKLISVLAVVSMLLVSGNLFAGAEELTPREYLIQVGGLPADLVNSLREETVANLYENAYGQDVDIAYETSVKEFPDTADGIVPYGDVIDPSKLRLNIFYINYYDSGTYALNRVYVVADFDWLKIPAALHTDTIAINWPDKYLAFDSSTFHSYCYGTWVGKPTVTISNSTALRKTAQGGLAYDIFSGSFGGSYNHVTEWYGNANFSLKPTTKIIRNSGVAGSIDMNYMHDGNPFSPFQIGVSIKGVSINLAEGMFNYPRAISHPWTVNE